MRISLYIAFLIALAIWVGGGVFDTISSHPRWYANPVEYVRASVVPKGAVNPWPFTTAALALCTLAALASFARYRGPGRADVFKVLLTTLAILIVTGVYFVPTLIQLSRHATLSDDEITSMSLMWMRLNLTRIVLLLALLVYAQVVLVKIARAPAEPYSRTVGRSA